MKTWMKFRVIPIILAFILSGTIATSHAVKPVEKSKTLPAVHAQAPVAHAPKAKAELPKVEAAKSPVAETPVPEHKGNGIDSSLALSFLVVLQLLGIGYLGIQIKKLKTELTVERQRHTQISQQLEYQALYDALTQLPNRRLFRDRLLQTMKVYNRSKTRFGVLMCDLDHFKEVNDTMGHDAGDMLLAEVTARLRKAIRESDTLARLGGDEFALICPSVQDMPTASVICMRLINAMRDPIVIKGKSFDIGISIGVSLFPEHASDDEMLMRRADMALYRAKEKRNTFIMFDPNIDRPKKRSGNP